MDLSRAIGILKTLTPLVEAIPVVGTELAVVLELASQACQSAEDAKAHREAYRQLAREVATYAAAVSRAAQSSPGFSPLTSGSEEGTNPQRESWVENIRELSSVFREVAETIEKRQDKDKKRRGQFLGGMRRLRYDVWHKDEDEEKVELLRKRVEEVIRTFHIEGEILGLGALERIEGDIKDMATRQAQELQAVAARQTAEREAIAARQTAEREAIAARQTQEREAIAARQAQDAETIAARQAEQLKAVTALQTEGIQQSQLYHQLTFMKQELRPVPGARFGEEGIPNGCLPNTREELMKQIRAWANDASELCPPIFGLTGLAGTGKTTVAVSFCEAFHKILPVITFFISRTSNDRRIPTRIVQTIAYQLGKRQASAREVISAALVNGQDITAQSLAEQIEGLFTAPLKAWEDSQLPVLVVIDALDECYKIDGREGGNLIPLIAAAIRQLPGRVKLLITSREEPEIWKMFKDLRLNTLENSIRLQNIEHAVVERDIKLYYAHHFLIISRKSEFEDETSWPPKASFDLLVKLTGKLFVFAALVVRLLSGRGVNPKKRLEEILQAPKSSTGVSVFKSLDELYLSVLEKAVDTGDEATGADTEQRIRNLIGALVLLQKPLDVRTISALLNEEFVLTKEDIEHLSAVLIIPDDPEEPITTFHPSFSDYVQLRCKEARFLITSGDHHAHLLHCCLAIMNRYLKRDICEIGNPSIMNFEIKNLSEKHKQFLPMELRYACEYWLDHLVNASNLDSVLIKGLNKFCERHLLHWIEVLSLLEKISVAHISLPGAINRWKQHQEPEAVSAASLLRDTERVVKTYDSPLRSCALQVYCSVLAFMPECRLYEHTRQETISAVEVRSGRLKSWPSVRQTLQGHGDLVTSVAYSSDGMRIVSGSSDKTVRVWDAITGAAIAELNGHSDYVRSVAFSPDGTRIVSGSDDETVRVWDAITGAAIAELNGHSDYVTSVAFSPDGTRIVSGSSDKTVRVWDAITGAAIAKLNGHTHYVTSVKFSEDGTQIISQDASDRRLVWHADKHFAINDSNHGLISRGISTSVSPSELSFDDTSGWLELVQTTDYSLTRLCWVPPERQGRFWAFGNLGVLFTVTGGMTILSRS